MTNTKKQNRERGRKWDARGAQLRKGALRECSLPLHAAAREESRELQLPRHHHRPALPDRATRRDREGAQGCGTDGEGLRPGDAVLPRAKPLPRKKALRGTSASEPRAEGSDMEQHGHRDDDQDIYITLALDNVECVEIVQTNDSRISWVDCDYLQL